MEQKYKTREEYLMGATALCSDKVFKAALLDVPTNIKVATSFPNKRANKSRLQTVGQCFPPQLSDGEDFQVMISPVISDPIKVLDILCHELIHVIDGCLNGHKGPFPKMMKAIGLIGKPTATEAGPELLEKLKAISDELGQYPHDALDTTQLKKQGTRMIKCECSECGMVVRASRKALENGPPHCWNPEHGPMDIMP